MIQYRLIKVSPQFLRWFRRSFSLNFSRLLNYLPTRGTLLDVGCGIGSLDYEIAKHREDVAILAIDIDPRCIELAHQHNHRPNISYQLRRLETVEGLFDCILFVDVFHHVPWEEHDELLATASKLLAPSGFATIVDIPRRGGEFNIFVDRYVSRCPEIYLKNLRDMEAVLDQYFEVITSEVHYKFPFPHYYIKARPRI